jgi:peroxin-2
MSTSYYSRLNKLFPKNPLPPYPRVGQLDASTLDSELFELLKTQLRKIFKFTLSDIQDNYEAELLVLLKLIIFKLTVWDYSATYGAKLQNLKFVDGRVPTSLSKPLGRSQKLGYALLVVGGDYIWNKLESYIYSGHYRDQDGESRIFLILRKFSKLLSQIWSVSSLFNFLMFLYTGKYSTLILRLLKIRLVPASRSLTRQVNYEFQNRQLVWNAFTEFLLIVVPLVNMAKLKRRFTKVLSLTLSSSGGEGKAQGELHFLPEKTCAICYAAQSQTQGGNHYTGITNPYKTTECRHIYCYVCITTKILESDGEGWKCLRCNVLVKSAELYVDINPDAIKISPEVFKEVDPIAEKKPIALKEESSEDESESDSENESFGSEEEDENEEEEFEQIDEYDDNNDEEYDSNDNDEEDDYDDEEDDQAQSGFIVSKEDF